MAYQATKVIKQFEDEDHMFFLEKIQDFYFQETYFMVCDLIGDYCENFDTLEEAQKDFDNLIEYNKTH
jgi:hypothetical protein